MSKTEKKKLPKTGPIGRRPMPDEDTIAEACRKFNGNMSAVATFLKVSRSTISRRVNASEELKKIVRDERSSTLDDMEEELFSQALNGNITALIFALKTQGYQRGYGDRSKLDVHGNFVSKEERELNAEKDAAYLGSVLSELEKLQGDGEESTEESSEESSGESSE
jgi:hypothetical protein